MRFSTVVILCLCFFLCSFQDYEKGNTDLEKIENIIADQSNNYFELSNQIKDFPFKSLKSLEKQSREVDYVFGLISALNNIGRYHRKRTDYKLALKNHQKALTLAITHKLKDIEIETLNLIGIVYRRKDDIRNALDFHQSAISKGKKIKVPSVSTQINLSIAENSLGNIYLSLRQYEKAIDQFNKAIELQSEIINIRGLAINFQNTGEAFEGLELYENAMENYQESLAYNKELDSDYGKIICTNSIASILIKQGDYQQALQKMDSILPVSLKVNEPSYLTQTYSNLGLIHLKLRDFKKAHINLDKALRITKNTDILKKHQLQVYYNLSELYRKLGEHEQAYNYFKIAVDEEKKTLGLRNTIYVNNLISKQDLQQRINEFNDLQSETKIKSLELARNRNILIITLVTIGLLSIVLYSMYRQHLLKNNQKVLLLEQQALQSQMNPHFIFNALNSIKHYIINNEQKNAVYYLNKFSKLIRNILDVSKVREVSLKEELSTMNLYMNIENIRFSKSITYIEDIDSNLNTDTIRVPPLILQPFIENAIWHGLSPKKGDKQIILEAFKLSDNMMEINIIDNGIGRVAAEKIKQKKSLSLSRKSVGIELTTERLTTFYNELADQFSLVYEDLEDEKRNPTGTKVTLRMPLG